MTTSEIYDGRHAMGSVTERDDGLWEAVTADGAFIAAMPTRKAATDALLHRVRQHAAA